MTPTTFPRKIDKLIGMRWFILPLVRNLVKNLTEGNEGTGHLYVLITLNFIATDTSLIKKKVTEKFLSYDSIIRMWSSLILLINLAN